jgi:hypothetical protein
MRNSKKSLTIQEYALQEKRQEHTVVYSSLIKWIDGSPQVIRTQSRIADNPAMALQDLVHKSLDLPYDGKDPALYGLSLGEAIILAQARRAADGDPIARKEILERILGAITQKNENVNVTGTLNDFLTEVAKKEKIFDVPATIEDDLSSL